MFGFRKEKHEPSPGDFVPADPAEAAVEGERPSVPASGATGSEHPRDELAGAGEGGREEVTAAQHGGAQGSLPGLLGEPVAESTLAAEGTLSGEERAERLRQLTELIDMVRPIIQQDGGDLMLVSADVEAGTVELQLQGACSSCAISATTLQAGVERILKDRLDWVTEVSGGVDEDIDWYESAAMGRGAYVPKW